jgi:hypothetical protein
MLDGHGWRQSILSEWEWIVAVIGSVQFVSIRFGSFQFGLFGNDDDFNPSSSSSRDSNPKCRQKF